MTTYNLDGDVDDRADHASEPNSVCVFVRDAVGGIYCHSCGDLAYEASAIKHAKWWTRQRASRMRACAPFNIVVERYYDHSAA